VYFIFIINDYQIGDEVFPAREIADMLLKENIWVYAKNTPNLKRISPRDQVLLYIAGKNNRFFYGYFEVKTKAKEGDMIGNNTSQKRIFEKFPLSCSIKVKDIWENPVMIYDVKEDLNFIKDKKNYGLYFRQGTKVINEEDFKLILERGKNLNKK